MKNTNFNQFIEDLHKYIDNGELKNIIYEVINEYGDIYLEEEKNDD